MSVYLKSVIGDFILCLAASIALAYTLCSGFYAAQPYQTVTGCLVLAGISAVFLVALFAISRNTTARIVGGIVLAVVVIAALGFVFMNSSGESVFDDVVGNDIFFAAIALLTPVAVYLLSRKRALCIVLVVLGVLLCAVMEYLYWYGHIVSFVIFVLSSAGLYVYRTYMNSVLNSESDRLAFGSVTVSGVALFGVSLLVASGLAFAVTAAVDMPNFTVKLLTKHYQVDREEVKGVGSSVSTENLSISSNTLGSDTVQSSDDSGTAINRIADGQSAQGEATEQETTGSDSDTNDDSTGDEAAGGGFLGMNFPNWFPFVVAAIIILLIVAAILLKKYLRKRRFEQIVSQPNGQAASELYLLFMDRFRRLKVPMPDALTLTEYTKGQAETFGRFEQTTGALAFPELTSVYMSKTYGGKEVSDEDLSIFKDYYQKFYGRMCRYAGRFRYCLLYFFV